MDSNLRFIGDHLPSLSVIGIDVDPLPSLPQQCSVVLHTTTGEYSVYSANESLTGSSWTRYPASKGLLTYYNNKVYGNTGSSWVDAGLGSDSGSTSPTVADLTFSLSTQERKLISNPTTRTYANAVINDTVVNPGSGFGSWINGSTFKFTQAGAYRIEAFGVLFAECVNGTASTKRIEVNAHLVVSGIAYWLGGGVSQGIEPSGTTSIYASGNVAGSASVYNVAVDDTAYLVIGSNANPGLSVLDVYFGITGGTNGGNGGSGIIITKA
jgi:hypothetical protein